jgi:hypothetical protein
MGVSFAALCACNVAPPPRGTGGFDAGSPGADGGLACASALSVVCSDYTSTNIAIANPDGTSASGSFVSSGSAPLGLALPLSGDVDVPLVAPPSGRVVLLDRYGTNVITWMDLAKAAVLAQLPVGTGFQSNPHDYIEVDATRAYVSRYGTNPAPGQMPFDQGGDLLILDTAKYAITGRIAMPEEDPALQPCPDTMTWLGKDVVVTLGRFSADFSMVGDGRFVGVSPSTDAVVWTVNVSGLQNCGRLALSPAGKVAALACSGLEDPTTGTYDPSHSDVVLYDATQTPPVETRRLGLGAKLGSGLQPQISFAGETTLVGLTYGGNATAGDTVFAVDTSSGAVTMLGSATMAYVLAGLRCDPGCSDVCVLGDAQKSVLRRWQVADGGTFTPMDDVDVDPTVGLPPRDVGALR